MPIDAVTASMEQSAAIEIYAAAIRGVAAYAPKLSADGESEKSAERGYLLAMAAEVARGDLTVLHESRSYLRCVLREYRDESARYLAHLRQELASTAEALRDVTCSLSQADSDGAARVQDGLGRLRAVPADASACPAAALICQAAADLEHGLAEMRKHHQLIVGQLHTEVRLLHHRMDSLSAADLDELSRLESRDEIEDRIALAAPGTFHVLVLTPDGLLRSRIQHNAQVFNDLLIAFTRRMRNSLPPDTPAGRWEEEKFIAIVSGSAFQAHGLAELLQRRLSGPYICRSEARTVITALQTRVRIIETSPEESHDRIIESIGALS